MNLIDAALGYAADHDWPVFPCHWIEDGHCSCGQTDCSAGKHPLTPAGFKDASTDPLLIKAWWSKWPLANIGIPTGMISKTAVVDVDDKSAFAILRDMLPNYDLKSVPRQKPASRTAGI